jgi:dTDP-4-amino-4,6-dideoxygalactose transaminase
MDINLVDLKRQYSMLNTENLINNIKKLITSGSFVGGPVLEEFESKFSNYNNCRYTIGVGSGTDALILALRSLGVGPGDEVIVPANTFIATAIAATHVGADVVFSDVNPDTYLMDESVESYITNKTKVIIPVHLYGNTVYMPKIMEIAKKYDLYVVEDCAQAIGAKVNGKNVGTFGDAGCFNGRSKVLTKDGYKTISSIRVGEEVLTHKNNYKKVTKLYNRNYVGDWVKLKLNGMRSTAAWGKRWLNATKEHPILVRRNNKPTWLPIKDVVVGDWVYIRSSRCSICNKKIPFFWDLCEFHNPAQKESVREKISISKYEGKDSYPNKTKHKHFYEDILPYANKLEKEGFRVIPIGVAIPDIIAIKDDKVIAYEIENQRTRERKLHKYDGQPKKYYDSVIWVEPDLVPNKSKVKHSYIEDESLDLVAVMVENKEVVSKKSTKVFNLEVEDDHSYFVADVAVHNCFSFYPAKNLGGLGQGGAVITNEDSISNEIRSLGNVGRADGTWYGYDKVGYNSRLDSINALFLSECLNYIDIWNDKRKNVALMYKACLCSADRLYKINENITLPHIDKGCDHVYHLYEIKTKEKDVRDRLLNFLKENGIGAALHYPITCNNQPIYYGYGKFPVAEELSETLISIPMHPYLSEVEVQKVSNFITKFYS